jgi:hypothetical protein
MAGSKRAAADLRSRDSLHNNVDHMIGGGRWSECHAYTQTEED